MLDSNSTSEDYNPFGMKQPGMSYNLMTGLDNGTGYRYGFNGMEQDFSFHNADGEIYNTHFRLNDVRLGRWLSPDPYASRFAYQSPYTSMDNHPINLTDVFGNCTDCPKEATAKDDATKAGETPNGDVFTDKDGQTFEFDKSLDAWMLQSSGQDNQVLAVEPMQTTQGEQAALVGAGVLILAPEPVSTATGLLIGGVIILKIAYDHKEEIGNAIIDATDVALETSREIIEATLDLINDIHYTKGGKQRIWDDDLSIQSGEVLRELWEKAVRDHDTEQKRRIDKERKRRGRKQGKNKSWEN